MIQLMIYQLQIAATHAWLNNMMKFADTRAKSQHETHADKQRLPRGTRFVTKFWEQLCAVAWSESHFGDVSF